jgi:hypothetical protein
VVYTVQKTNVHTYEANFLQGLLKNKDRKLAQTFNSSFRYIDDVLSLNNFWFDDYLYLIYPINELEVKKVIDLEGTIFWLQKSNIAVAICDTDIP